MVNAVARGLGGRGSARATRASLVWGSAPALIPAILALIVSFTYRDEPRALWPSILVALFALIGIVWSIIIITTMLARVQGFRAWRAFAGWLVGDVVAASVLAAVIRTLLFQPFSMSSGSMTPTLLSGDYVFASKWDYGFGRYSFPYAPRLFDGRIFPHEPRRGDVIVFRKLPDDVDYVKRIVGLPGDKIQMIHARLFINGQLVERRKIEPGVKIANHFGKIIEAPTYEEILPGGATYKIVQIEGDDDFFSNTAVFDTPAGAYFVLGDNRDNSVDSRVSKDRDGVGFVPLETIFGRARLIYYSIERDKDPAPLRPERIGLGVE